MNEPTKGRLLDRFKLLTLEVGKTRYMPIESASRLQSEMRCITRAAEHYRNKGYMQHPVFSVAVITQDEVGILYGLKKGHSND